MNEIQTQRAGLSAWLDAGESAGFLEPAQRDRYEKIESAVSADLFAGGARPLVVGLFGGTGVGKSSLLNRLVGQQLARTGVQRPTSHEITAYLHEAVDLQDMPPELPADKLQVGRHSDDGLRDVMLLDMPDIDSTATENRDLVFEWLARVDLLIYVVSPERYRDDIGWSVLRERGHRHGWLFVINHWDNGDARQADDLAQLLHSAGFADPLIFRTSCSPDDPTLPTPDEFEQLVGHIRQLRASHEIAELSRLGIVAQTRDLRDWMTDALGRFGAENEGAPQEHFEPLWTRFAETVREGVDFPIRSAAGQFARQEGAVVQGWLQAVRGRKTGQPEEQLPGRIGELVSGVWDEWAETRLGETVDAFDVALRRAGLASAPHVRALQPLIEGATERTRGNIESHLRTHLAHPGNVLQRLTRQLLGALTILLPIAAIGWIGWVTVTGFGSAAAGETDFLGTSFAVHSLLLIFVAWLAPFGLDQLLRPSLQNKVDRGLRAGVDHALEQLVTALREALAASDQQRRAMRQQGSELLGQLSTTNATPSPGVQRMLVQTPSELG